MGWCMPPGTLLWARVSAVCHWALGLRGSRVMSVYSVRGEESLAAPCQWARFPQRLPADLTAPPGNGARLA